MSKPKFQSPTGMRDVLPEEQKYFEKIANAVKSAADFYQFQKIDTPILEQAELFLKGVGMSTDIIEKQMFLLRTKGGDTLALRPEGTAPVARAYIERGMINLPQPVKLWYLAPFFRYEHPQAGRFRQFWQFGLEVLGEQSSALDAQVIQIFYNILKELKLKNLVVQLNSIGDSACRPYYKKILSGYFKTRINSLCADCRRRLRENPLRVLDCKEEKCQRIISGSPQIIDHLCEPCHKHFKEVLEFLDETGLPYHLNPYLVRGLDYYTKTVFEIVEESAEGKALGTLAAGGRYDNLVKILGGQETPSVGGAAGLERIIETIRRGSGQVILRTPHSQVFIAQLGASAKRKCLKLIEEFRDEGIKVAESLGRDSLKAQLKIADKEEVLYTLILGQQEVLQGVIIIRDMKNGKQETVKLERAVAEIKKRLRR